MTKKERDLSGQIFLSGGGGFREGGGGGRRLIVESTLPYWDGTRPFTFLKGGGGEAQRKKEKEGGTIQGKSSILRGTEALGEEGKSLPSLGGEQSVIL